MISKFITSRLITVTKSLCPKIFTSEATVTRSYTARRAIIYVPCDDSYKTKKAVALEVDCIAFDLAHTVIEKQKACARRNLMSILQEGTISKENPEWCVRVNPVHSEFFNLDMDTVFLSKNVPNAIILPDINSPEELEWFTEQLWKRLTQRPGEERRPINLLVSLSTPRGLMSLKDICKKAEDLSKMAPIIPAGLIFDSNRFIDSIGGSRTTHGIEYMYARQKLVLVAKAYGLQAIDILFRNQAAVEEFSNECKEGATMGFTGKQILYPSQIALAHSIFSPSRSQVRWAQRIIEQLKKKDEETIEDQGKPVIDDGQLRVAENIINVAKFTGKLLKEAKEQPKAS